MASPARLHYARYLAAEREKAEANPAEFELSVVGAGTAAHLAPIAMTHGKLGPAIEFGKLRSTGHVVSWMKWLRLRCVEWSDRAPFDRHAR
jgi:hypothetical protein